MRVPQLLSQARLEDMARLSDVEHARISVLEQAFLDILSGYGSIGSRLAAAEEKIAGAIPPKKSGKCRLSARSLERLFARWRKRGWRALLPKYGNADSGLPRAFVLYWQKIYINFSNDNSGVQARNALLSQYESWKNGVPGTEPIPGYAEPPRCEANGFPRGWSYDNLMLHRPSKIVTAGAKKGRHAARENGPQVLTTRKYLEPGMVYMFDDLWHDIYVSYPGQRKLVRPLELGALDIASGKKVAWGLRPRLWDGDKTTGLKSGEMGFLLATLLSQYGYHPDGCCLVVERGTAAISAEDEKLLYEISGGKITVLRGGVDRLPAWDGGFAGSAKGNSRFKAALESHHNLLHNALAFLPGYSGNNRTVPEDTQGMMALFEKFSRDLDFLSPEDMAKISSGNISFDVFYEYLDRVVRMINNRTEHNLEGWETRQITEIRPTLETPWMRADPTVLPQALLDVYYAKPELHRVRKMSPEEYWGTGSAKLKKIPMYALGRLARGMWQKKRVNQYARFDVSDPDGGVKYVFGARIADEYGHDVLLTVGSEYNVFLNPFKPDELNIYDLAGRYIGTTVDLIEREDKRDVTALEKATGKVNAHFTKMMHPLDALKLDAREIRKAFSERNVIIVDSARKRLETKSAEEDRLRKSAIESDSFVCLPELESDEEKVTTIGGSILPEIDL